MPYTAFLAGQTLTAAKLNAAFDFLPLIATKTADESLPSSTTFQDDDHLQIAFAVATYTIDGWLAVEGPTAGDAKFRFAWTGTLTRFDYGISGLALAATTAEADLKSIAQIGATTSPSSEITIGTITANWSNIPIYGHMVASAAGTLKLQWAQVVSDAANTIVKQGSFLRLTKK